MFIYSMRAGTLRFFGIVCVALIGLVTLMAFVPELQPTAATESEAVESESVSFEKIRSNEDRIGFLSHFGWQVEEAPLESTTVTVPREFDKVFSSYNELQRAQGLDLSAYAGKTVERYTYTVKNYEGYEGTVYANLLIWRGRVIGGDICSADSAGFIHGLTK
ncbi:MAG: DUF4830 domain-containing protein [Ruminococcaceae bacterium]|nr:DUF4830 domain-containing protein [Oscillospiraceae bacterium]